jgi:hypothetical protein
MLESKGFSNNASTSAVATARKITMGHMWHPTKFNAELTKVYNLINQNSLVERQKEKTALTLQIEGLK